MQEARQLATNHVWRAQVEKLSQALTLALSELHARGADLAFDWKDLVFLDPTNGAQAVGAVPAAIAPTAEPGAATPKRPAASGSMAYLQSSVMDAKSAVR
jgi:hypothetical protein